MTGVGVSWSAPAWVGLSDEDYSNLIRKKAVAVTRRDKRRFAMLSTVDHVKAESEPDFEIVSWQTNDAKGDMPLRSSLLTAAELFRSQISIESQQASSDERLHDFSHGGRVQIHVGDGAGDQISSDPEPLLSGC